MVESSPDKPIEKGANNERVDKGKGKKKNSKKGKAKTVKTEWDDLDVESLTRVIATMKAASEKLEKESFDAKLKCEAIRGKSKEAQTEADELAKQIESVKAEILEMQHHHELEKCDYDSKLAHLEYINANMPNGVLDEQNQREIERMNLENEGNHVAIWNNVVQSGNDESLRLQKEHTEEISALQKQHQEEYDKLQQQLEDELVELKQRCKEREDAVQEELKLRYMIEIREQEERDSEYIQSIRQKHQNAVSEMKSFYSKLEHENVREIDSLQEENRKLQQDTDDLFQNAQNIEKENACLVEPLSKAELEVAMLSYQLKNRERDLSSLEHTRAQITFVEKKVRKLQTERVELERRLEAATREKKELHDRFDESVADACCNARFESLVLEGKIKQMSEAVNPTNAVNSSEDRLDSLDSLESVSSSTEIDDGVASRDAKMKVN